MSGLMARKIGMTRVFREDGKVMPVTVLEAGPCPVVQIRTLEKDGYEAIQIGYKPQKLSRLNKAKRGHLEKGGIAPVARLREIPSLKDQDVKVGDILTVSLFNVGEKVDVMGKTKGKGFQGVVKRHGYSGGDSSHGCKSKRVPGSIGQCATPGRVWKGKGMPGRTGGQRITVRNLEIIRVDVEHNLLAVKGAVPGAKNSYLLVRKTGRRGGRS